MKRLLYLAASILLSCGDPGNEPVKIPESVLSIQKMSEVVADIHIAEAEANLNSPGATANRPDSTGTGLIAFHQAFEKNGIHKDQYDSSLAFYSRHPALLDSIYTLVINHLDRQQAEAAKP